MPTITLQIRVKPNARISLLTQLEPGSWTAQLKSPPVDGKANAELVALVAEHFGRAKTSVSIKSGASGRLKLVQLAMPYTCRSGRLHPLKAESCAMASAKHRHNVYVVLLDMSVWSEPSFRRANPDHDITKPCVYVGMTGLDPDLRFDRHKAGIQANRFAQIYGVGLLPALYEVYNPMPYDVAREMEVELAIGLRERGYAVWQA